MKRLGILLLVILTLSVFRAPSAGADYQPPGGAAFNVPKPWGTTVQRYRIVNTVEEAIENTPAGSTILISTFLLDRWRSVNGLIDACKRGVRVRVILDGDISNKAANTLIATLNSDNEQDLDGDGVTDPQGPSCNGVQPGTTIPPEEAADSVVQDMDESAAWGPDHSYVVKCRGACRGGTGGNMHSKFFAFSQTGTAQNVVMVSSSNLNAGGALKGWNDLFVMKQRPLLYDRFKLIHREMTDDKPAVDEYQTVDDGPYLVRFFPKPGADQSSDPTLQDLNQIKCHGSPYGATRVNVSMFYWAGDRGKYIANKLISLGKAGCKVSVIYGAPSKEVRLQLRAAAVKHLISVYDSRRNLDRDPECEVRTHGKYILVKGVYGNDVTARVVSTGSQNWVGGSLRKGDELTLNIDDGGAAYVDYIANWENIRKHSVRIPQT